MTNKKPIKVYLSEDELSRLKTKAEVLGESGRGWLSHFLAKISNNPLLILDGNVRALLEALKLEPKKGFPILSYIIRIGPKPSLKYIVCF